MTTEKSYEQGQISYVFTLKKTWRNGYNASVRIYNNGSEVVDNWALCMDYPICITNIWNATIEDDSDGRYTIKNASWNADIKPGRSVEYGFSVKGDFTGFPESFSMLGIKSAADEQGYAVEYFVDNEWKTGFVGRIVITNVSDEQIEDWTLSFCYDREITSIWNAYIESHEGNRYVIKNKSYNANIMPGETASFGFKGKGGTPDDKPADYLIESVSFNTGAGHDTDPESFEDRIEEVMQRYDESNYDLDTDGDGLKDCEEEILGTDLNAKDTDGDSLSDHDEVYQTWTDPLIFDSAVPGCPDSEADSDGDGIPNITEIVTGTNPLSEDTDNDGISDNDEINVYGTNPVLIDTDRDGIEDNHELILGLDPLKNDSDGDGIEDGDILFSQEAEAVFENNACIAKVRVTAEATNLFPEVTTISENTRCLNEDFDKVGVLGTPVEISTESYIESAQIAFYLREGYNAGDYVVLWFDDENSRFVECDTDYDDANGIVIAHTTHFSTYFLASWQAWNNTLEKYFALPNWDFETIVVFDFSTSMGVSDSMYADFTYGLTTSKRRIDIGKVLFGRSSKTNRQGVVFFNNNGSVVARLGSTESELKNTLKILEMYKDSYNTNIKTALGVALDELLTSEDKNAIKSIVLISDGGAECEGDKLTYDREVLERAKSENVRIHTVALGDNAVMDNLREIADVTGGTSFVYAFHNASYIADKVFAIPVYSDYLSVKYSGSIKELDILGSKAYLRKLRKRVYSDSLDGSDYIKLAKKKAELMMQDYYDYSRIGNPNEITDAMWDAYCTEFNLAIILCEVYSSDIHYFRNKLNRAPATIDDLIAEKKKWILLDIKDSLYHMYGDDNALFNKKFISNDGTGKYEGVYNKAGLLLTEENDPKNMGTYNFCSHTNNIYLHILLDVKPYWEWGNVIGCSGEVFPRSKGDFYACQEAVEAYNKMDKEVNEN